MTARALPALAAALAALAVLSLAPAARADGPGPRTWASCVEHVPKGATRPEITESFPAKGTSGWASMLEVTVKHGKGETVLPEGFHVQSGSDAGRALEEAGFVIPRRRGASRRRSGPTRARGRRRSRSRSSPCRRNRGGTR